MDEATSPAAKPTQIPSWVMLGFVVGVLFMLALPRRDAAPVVPAVAAPAAVEPVPPAPQIRTIDAVFAVWGKYAMWDNDTTEVALWNSGTKDFSECYEVLRAGDSYFFRPIPRLTRPILHHGVPDAENAPLRFTETATQEEEWRKEAQAENWRAFSDALHPATPKPAATP